MGPSELINNMPDLTFSSEPAVSFIIKPIAEEIRRRLEAAAEMVRANRSKGLVDACCERGSLAQVPYDCPTMKPSVL